MVLKSAGVTTGPVGVSEHDVVPLVRELVLANRPHIGIDHIHPHMQVHGHDAVAAEAVGNRIRLRARLREGESEEVIRQTILHDRIVHHCRRVVVDVQNHGQQGVRPLGCLR